MRPDLLPLFLFLQNDRDALQQQLQQEREDRSLRLELTGPRGVPVHLQGSMKDGFSFNKTTKGEVTSFWVVRFDLNIHNFIDTVAGLEL